MPQLEDAFGDVVGKARRGRGISEAELADKVGIAPGLIGDIERYEFVPDDDTLAALARALGLKPAALSAMAHDAYEPAEPRLETWGSVRGFSSEFSGYLVNAYIVWDKSSRKAVLFDTGTDIEPIRSIVREERLSLESLALTHTHRDHVAILAEVRREFRPRVFASPREPVPDAELVAEGDSFAVGSLSVEARETAGHSPGGLTFVVSGFDAAPPVAVVGDALFAGSAGGASVSYEALHSSIRSRILTLPDDTLILPGHGPMTTVGEEKANNPFAP